MELIDKKTKIVGVIDNYIDFNINILKQIVDDCNIFNLCDYDYFIKSKTVRDYIKNPEPVNDTNIVNVSIYSLILFESDDNKKGKLIFEDGTILKPQTGKYILFDSNLIFNFENSIDNLQFKLIRFFN